MIDPKTSISPVGSFFDCNVLALYAPILFKEHLNSIDSISRINSTNSRTFIHNRIVGFVSNFIFDNEIITKFSNWKLAYIEDLGSIINRIYLCDNAAVQITYFYSDKQITVASVQVSSSLDNDISIMLKDIEVLTEKKLDDSVYTIVTQEGRLTTKPLGQVNIPLIRENYLDEVISDIDYVIDSYKNEKENGRVCLLNGEPGTGKTFLIKSLISEVNNAIFLIIPNSLVSVLDTPDFLTTLLEVRQKHNKPIILIIEDGDSCIKVRQQNNMSAISALLNMSEGIIGSLLNVRVIITTNLDLKEIDEAARRPGRLCKHINVGLLPFEKAEAIYKRLMNDDNAVLGEIKKYYSLAEIYSNSFTEEKETRKQPKKSGTIGFKL